MVNFMVEASTEGNEMEVLVQALARVGTIIEVEFTSLKVSVPP